MTPVRALLAKNVAAIRKSRGLSQEALAELAETTNVHVSRIETGESWPKDDMIMRIAVALDTPAAAFFSDPSAVDAIPPAITEHVSELAKLCGLKVGRGPR